MRMRGNTVIGAVLLIVAMVAANGAAIPSASALGLCPSPVVNETDLGNCIAEFNALTGDVTTMLGANITLTAALPALNATGDTFRLDGEGYSIDAGGQDYVFVVLDGALTVDEVSLTGAAMYGLRTDSGSASLSDSTISGNAGGVEVQGGSFFTVNTTIAENTGDGIFMQVGVTVGLNNTSVVDNSAHGVDNLGATLNLTGSLVARNGGSGCTDIASFSTLGVFGDTTCDGVATAELEALLDPGGLALNGCTVPCTSTVALLAKSPAINAAGSCAFFTDQRGVSRLGGCDAGAFEFLIPTEFCDGALVSINLKYLPDPVVATGGDDVIQGTDGADLINGLAGDDTICGNAGADEIRGGAGADTIIGGDGADEILGGGGADTIFGGADADTIAGQGGSDTIRGGTGPDTIDGQGAADTIHGEGGLDVINGQNGADDLNGGSQADTIKGHTGPDRLVGEGGDDDLVGGAGNDTLQGGPGTDRCAGNTGGADQAEAATCESTPGVEILF